MAKIDIDTKREHMSVVKDRFETIRRYVTNKDVLDLGCVCHDVHEAGKEVWLHGFIEQHAANVTGVDYLQEEVDKLRKQGYNMIRANVETMKLDKKYDVVVAGGLIEHLDNVGLFLNRVSVHLKKDGIFIITTGNAFSLRNILYNTFFGAVPVNAEHAYAFCPKTLKNIVLRHGFTIVERHYYFDDSHSWKSKIEQLISIRKSFVPGMIYVCKKH